MEWYHAVVLGIVEGITEFLPVSSTGHLIIVAQLLGVADDAETRAALDGYIIFMQGFALLAIVGLYHARLRQMAAGLVGRDPAGRKLLLNVTVAFLPIAVLGPVLHTSIKALLFRPWPVLVALFLGGVWMIWIDRRRRQLGEERYAMEVDDLTWKQALGIGLFQCVSMWPGTSRAMMTIAGGTVLGMKPARAAEFSFLLGLPTILGATVYEFGTDTFLTAGDRPGMMEVLGVWPFVLGIGVTVIAATAAVAGLVTFLGRYGLSPFGWYRIALSVVLGAMLFSGMIVLIDL